MIKVYTGGTFDVLHAGHVNFFRQIKALFPGCELIVSLNTDEFILEYKGKSPVFSYGERVDHLRYTGYIDEIVPNIGGADSKPAIERAFEHWVIDDGREHEPLIRIIAIGQDWLAKDYCKQMQFDAQWLTNQNISLIYIPHTDGISTTEIKRRLAHEEN